MTGGSARGLQHSAVALLCVLSLPALASEFEIELKADVVFVTNQGSEVDPSLQGMKQTFAKEGLAFTSYKKLSSHKVVLPPQKPVEVPLANQKKAILTLEGLKKGAASINVKIGALTATYSLGREGSVFINFDRAQGGEFVLVLSPSGARKSRRALDGFRPAWFPAPRE